MRKLIVSVSLAAAFVVALPFAAQAGVPEAVSYLKSQPQDEWVVQAEVAAGEKTVDKTSLQSFSGSSATDYAKRILAIVAVGENPRSFAGADLVAGLKGLANGGQIGDPGLLNDDAWAILALRAAGVSAADPIVGDSVAFLLSKQNADGGWSYAPGVDSDSNDTAAVLMALSDVGNTSADVPVASALTYLATQQVDGGGFVYQLPCFWPGCDASDSASTSWVVSALAKLGLNPASWTKGSATPFDFLQSLQTGDGSFKWQAADPAGSAGMTAYAVVALSNDWYPVPPLPAVLPPAADVALTESVSASAPHEGDQVTYTLTVTNAGPDQATGVAVTDHLPTEVAYVSDDSSGAYSAGTGVWIVGAVASGASTTFHLTVAVNIGTAGSTVTNATSVQADQADVVASNNSASASFAVAALVSAGSAASGSGSSGGGFICTNPDPATLDVSLVSHSGNTVVLGLTYPSTITALAVSRQADLADASFEPSTLTHSLTVGASDTIIYVRFRNSSGCTTDKSVALGQVLGAQAESTLPLAAVSPIQPTPAVLGASDVGCQLTPDVFLHVSRSGFVLVDLGSAHELWYLDPVTHQASCAEGESRVLPLLRRYALGITNANVAQVGEVGTAGAPGPLAKRLAGRILLQVEEHGEAWYVDPSSGARTYLPPTAEAFITMRALAPLIPKP